MSHGLEGPSLQRRVHAISIARRVDGLWAYKTVFTFDGPVQLFGKTVQFLWRKATGARVEKAEKSRQAVRGGWQFLTRELVRFWRA